MDIQGSLEAMNLPTLVQFVVQDGGRVLVQLEHDQQVGRLYLNDGQLCHAELHDVDEGNSLAGETAVYELLSWHSGRFVVRKDVPLPTRNIQQNWDFLLMEGLRRLDERQANDISESEEESLADILSNLSESDAAAIQQLIAQQEVENEMATKSEQIRSILNNVVSNSADITGAVIVDNDGLLLASALNGSLDSNRVAAVTAGLISLAGRSAQQLGQGEVAQTLIRAANGNVVAMRAGGNAAFVALTPPSANLGMLFMECRDAATAIADALR